MRPIHRFAVLLPLIAACGEGPLDPGEFRFDGAWLGRAYPFELSFDVEHDGDNRVAGTGRVGRLEERLETAPNPVDTTRLDTLSIDTVVTGTVDFDVSGQWDYPDFSLRLRSDGYADAAYEARFTDPDSVSGSLRGSGFNNLTIVVVRQDDGS